ncbi:Vta1 like-domain-containing protein [Kockiozyma suomiensis]|uniref:Vta1 like-domain-containing protein n=1 Tax=Kockiozyma suomiensis TaxID=1337062 RepID=UPI0033438EA1
MSTLQAPPSSLKFIQPFIARARELEKADPVISYYCKYYAIEEALASKIHQADPEAAEYVTNLLDLVEKDKTALSDRDTINDEVVAQAYVERFASRVFANAEKDIINKTATKTTATNLFAASSFLELLKLFGEPDQQLQEQIKYCKFHAVRILRAINSNQDPNTYEEPLPQSQQTEDTFLSPSSPSPPLQQPLVSQVSGPPSSFSPSAPPQSFTSPPPPSFTTTHQPPPQTFTAQTSVPPPAQPAKHESVQQIMDEAQRFSLAQKHSKYAISALNYEDVETAVKELKTALRLLGENI